MEKDEKGAVDGRYGDINDINKNVHIEQLLMTLDSEQWISLSGIRKVAYPITLEDKRKLISEMIIK